jgi:hypothetical protein
LKEQEAASLLTVRFGKSFNHLLYIVTEKMFKASYHPKAFLSSTKNVKQGLAARTKIASVLDRGASTAKAISGDAGTSYSSVMHHLHLMENDEIVKRSDKKPYIWGLTGMGQRRLTEI